jgi:hypothetical protein
MEANPKVQIKDLYFGQSTGKKNVTTDMITPFKWHL